MKLIARWWGRRKQLTFSYAPRSNGEPDAGEICWAWVPYEEDPRQGKDRPVLIIGRRGRDWLALMLTSKDHSEYLKVTTDRYGHRWLDIGAGAWDRERRPSEVRLDRLLVLSDVRREGAAIDKQLFDRIVALGQKSWK